MTVRLHGTLVQKLSWVEEMIGRHGSVFENITDSFPDIPESSSTALIQREILVSFIEFSLYEMIKSQEIYQNEEIPKKLKQNCMVSIVEIVKKTFTALTCNPVCQVVALMYVEKYMKNKHEMYDVSLVDFSPVFCCCVMLATKMWEDKYYFNTMYLDSFGLIMDLQEWNHCERVIFEQLDYNLVVSREEFHSFIQKYASKLSPDVIKGLYQDKFIERFQWT
jgi:hypothetical protein